MGMSEQIERKTYVTCCVKNYKKNKKNDQFVPHFEKKYNTLLNIWVLYSNNKQYLYICIIYMKHMFECTIIKELLYEK